MIQPLVSETEWLDALSSSPLWDPPKLPMLIVAPHPDDETLGAGGLIAAQSSRGINILVAAVTDGERAYPDAPGLAQLRQTEQTEALARLGVSSDRIVRFGLPDSDVASREDQLVERLAPLVSENTHVIAPWSGDFHPDHQACGRSSEQVARKAGALLTSYFFWTWHFGKLADLHGLSLRRFALTPTLLRAKTDALQCHQSQLMREGEEPVLTELLLRPAKRPFELFAIA